MDYSLFAKDFWSEKQIIYIKNNVQFLLILGHKSYKNKLIQLLRSVKITHTTKNI